MGGVGAVEQARATIRVRSGGKPASWCLLVLFEGCRQGYSPYETQVDGLPIWGMSDKNSFFDSGLLNAPYTPMPPSAGHCLGTSNPVMPTVEGLAQIVRTRAGRSG
jgi:hypothetical protein